MGRFNNKQRYKDREGKKIKMILKLNKVDILKINKRLLGR